MFDLIANLGNSVVESVRRKEDQPKQWNHYITDPVVDGVDAVKNGYNTVSDGLGKARDTVDGWVRSILW